MNSSPFGLVGPVHSPLPSWLKSSKKIVAPSSPVSYNGVTIVVILVKKRTLIQTDDRILISSFEKYNCRTPNVSRNWKIWISKWRRCETLIFNLPIGKKRRRRKEMTWAHVSNIRKWTRIGKKNEKLEKWKTRPGKEKYFKINISNSGSDTRRLYVTFSPFFLKNIFDQMKCNIHYVDWMNSP